MKQASLPAPTALGERARKVLDENWTGDHTVPSRSLYPHQWSWDSGFIAIGLAVAAPERGWRELRSLFCAQWPDGRVPHIVFDPDVAERDYFPGPAFWDAPQPPDSDHATTGVIQPPVHALAAWELYRRTGDGDQLSWLYPRLVAQQNYLARNRDLGGNGLASIVHPWESGQDNSPAWDLPLAAVPADMDLLRRHRRRDIAVAESQDRPTDADYARYIALAESYRAGGYRDADLLDRHPFVVEDPAFNAIVAAAELSLADIAEAVGADPVPHKAEAARITHAVVTRLYDRETGMFHARDVRTGGRSPAHCIGGLIPLLLPDLPAELADSLVQQASSDRFGMHELPVPSYDRTAPDFDTHRYWRGPIWVNMNWLLLRGLRVHGYYDRARMLRRSMLAMIERCGCYEYYHPVTCEGIGAEEFSWTAALALDMLFS
ncbi:MAG: hypothetical protein J2P15_04290 [Micromonosporaceae bacterium]|nr:hypothetical protein [Micromonosporaceae bacterium]